MSPPSKLFSHLQNEQGQGLVEYALILVLISIVAIAAMKIVGSSTCNMISKAASEIKSAN